MPPLLALALAVLVTWGARTASIVLVPAERLSLRMMARLDDATPAVFGALTMTALLNARAAASSTVVPVLALGVAGVLAYRRMNLAVVVLGAMGTATALRLLGVS
jgi:branched-subunit amino acid transport protein